MSQTFFRSIIFFFQSRVEDWYVNGGVLHVPQAIALDEVSLWEARDANLFVAVSRNDKSSVAAQSLV